MPTMPRDDRLDLGASGKLRSDPARTRSLRTGGTRGRGRHSIDLGHDLKRAMAAQTIHEDVRAPDSCISFWLITWASVLCAPLDVPPCQSLNVIRQRLCIQS